MTIGKSTGKVKWFNNAKGYGFILPDGGGDDLFAHYSSIEMDGYKTLKAGQDVTFDLHEGPKGSHAVNIAAVDVDSSTFSGDDLIVELDPDRETHTGAIEVTVDEVEDADDEPLHHPAKIDAQLS